MTQPNNYAPSDIRSRLIAFEALFVTAMQSKPDQWLTPDLIETMTAGPQTTVARFPVPLNSAGYRAHKGEIIYRRLSEKTFDTTFGVFSDGVSELVTNLMSNSWTGWGSQAAALARQGMPFGDFEGERAVAALEGGISFTSWDGVPFFSASHPVNCITTVGGVQSNVKYSATVGNTTLDALRDQIRGMKAPDGKELGLDLTGLLYPTALATGWENVIGPLNGAQIVAPDGEINPFRWRGRIWGKRVWQMTLPTVYYAVATNRPDIKPLAGMRKLAPQSANLNTGMVTVGDSDIETFVRDMTHPDYEKTGEVGIGKKKYYEARTAIHTCIIRCNTAASD
jgi:hypothetical protein